MIFKRLARSELLSTFFPTWIWQGRMWAKGKVPKYDPYYWINAHSHPVISTYYFPHGLSSSIAQRLNINNSYKLLLGILLAHVSFGFIGWYLLLGGFSSALVALFGAITFTLAGYNWKQQPCFQYTVAWFPWLLLGIAKGDIWLSGFCLGMVLLAGYYPVGLQCILIAILASLSWEQAGMIFTLLWTTIGVCLGLAQIIPFLMYLPKTIRANKHDDIGRVPWWHFASLIFPKAFRHNINGVGYWEMSYYVGIIPLFLIWYTTSKAWILLALAFCLMLGAGSSYLPRISARWSYTFQFALIWCAINGLSNLNLTKHMLYVLILVQLFDLLSNNLPLLITAPYSELYQRPSWAFNTKLTRFLEANLGQNRVSGLPYPLFTGHINKLKTLGYSGGMQLKLMSKWRKDLNPNGSGEHDWFKNNKDDNALDRSRVKFAYTSTKIDWETTSISKLYRNPRLS